MNKLTLNEPAMNELKESAKKEPDMGEANAMPWVSVELIDDLRLGERTDLHIFSCITLNSNNEITNPSKQAKMFVIF